MSDNGTPQFATGLPEHYDVMIVEDEPVSRRALASLVMRNGFHVAAFSTAEAALDAIRSVGLPPVLLVDLDLPGMSGAELLRTLERVGGHTFPVLITAASREVVDQLGPVRQMPYLRKPLDFTHLMRVLAERHVRN